MITFADIEAARARIAPHVRQTPVLPLDHLKTPADIDAHVDLKLELLQVTGSFKARGAMNRFLGLPEDRKRLGIVTASGGNHGLAVARTAYVAGAPAVVFVPATTSPAKIDKMRAWGATVNVVGDVWEESNAAFIISLTAFELRSTDSKSLELVKPLIDKLP